MTQLVKLVQNRGSAAFILGNLLVLALTACGGSTVPAVVTPAPTTSQGASTGGTVSTQTLSPEEAQILAAVNVARSQARVCGTEAFAATTPLTWNTLLATAATAHSQDLANVDFTADPTRPDLMHLGSNGSTFQQRIEAAGYTKWTNIGENFAAGYDVSQVVDAWIASPGHCKNLMSPKFHEIGVGYVYSVSAKYHTYYTQDFGTR
ncbi:CAP domain-containing protein [Deinococcus ruber]|uniref:SCP domain-containing protein n=1 Tax=Deinococcus ruber TaxID=1848197 RepID=A0A918C0N6_9DEIO|nr:CAP domain-containing protein [Deinococcus ruber]GGR01228.1 hypothetical protein GCM10008957_12730 [Deinococcus ruber]